MSPPHPLPQITEGLVCLLRNCPDVVTTRKELLVITRHMLQTGVRNHLQPRHIDELLDERVMAGVSRACQVRACVAHVWMAGSCG